MGDEIFPCRRVEFESPCENPRDLVNSWIKNRYSEQWALISGIVRAGIIVGEKYGYIVDLSCNASEEDFTSHAAKMNFTILDDRPSLEIFDAKRLGIDNGEDENAAIGHVLTSDLR